MKRAVCHEYSNFLPISCLQCTLDAYKRRGCEVQVVVNVDDLELMDCVLCAVADKFDRKSITQTMLLFNMPNDGAAIGMARARGEDSLIASAFT